MDQPIATHRTVADFCEGLETNSIRINRDYQRQPGVWPAEAQSFLIETILLGYPVPKLALHVVTDRLTKRTINEIVDGQQRATAIQSFANDGFRLSGKLEIEEARGKLYSELPAELQQLFLSYQVGFDQLVNVDERDIREIFRRINSYEVPLNPEEQRHARHQGPFKWFIYQLAKEYGERLKAFGTFTEQQLIRMQDMKLLAEVSHGFVHGIKTTNKLSLNKLCDSRDTEFPEEDEFERRIRDAFDLVGDLEELHDTELMKHYSLYSLILSITHARRRLETLNEIGPGGRGLASRGAIVAALSVLLRALDEEDAEDGLEAFRAAFEKGTNVAARRLTRAQHYLEAVSAE